MNLKHILLTFMVIIACIAALCVGNGYAKSDNAATVLRGEFSPLPGYEEVEITGIAHMVCNKNRTIVVVEVEGLDPEGPEMCPTHVHNLSCADGGGGHYEIDPGLCDPITDPDEKMACMMSNEIWPFVMNNEDGTGYGKAKAEGHNACGAMSVIIHDPVTGNKMLCADLM